MRRLLAAATFALAACARDPLTPIDHVQLTEETADEATCQSNADAGRASVDACRAKVETAWSAYWKAYFAAKDGGTK